MRSFRLLKVVVGHQGDVCDEHAWTVREHRICEDISNL